MTGVCGAALVVLLGVRLLLVLLLVLMTVLSVLLAEVFPAHLPLPSL